MAADNPRLAVLIDADNTPAAIVDGLFDEIARLGEASVRRIYGDFAGPHLKKWQAPLMGHAINPTQQFAYTKGKNASDITLVIEAMDLMHDGRVDGFCLVSSDSDFTRLASRIREQGMTVYGFGAQRTPEAFVKACTRFIYIENLVEPVEEESAAPAPATATTASAPAATKPAPSRRRKTAAVDEVPQPIRVTPSKAVPLFHKAMSQMEDEDGWYDLSALGNQLNKLYPDFDPRTYGHAKLSTLVGKTGAFEDRKSGRHIEVRRKPQKQG
ncbi:NYN domain-containing protein [Paroceanicella profunda]|uniref:NYN domain-containing protein n=1 Tax=Paroceanicella profunda TaxID=2579971 RepID=A0A5B8FTT4_9RHOB|nr:NYN domain-containing protein [Paroceanicella profunda]QDL92196.1 NYN domain-containing protein [Paroceanicella profunda]